MMGSDKQGENIVPRFATLRQRINLGKVMRLPLVRL